MALKKLKIVIWCGAAANQRALANKIAAEFDVAGIVIDMHTAKPRKRTPGKFLAIIWDRFRFRKIYKAWSNLMRYYQNRYTTWPATRCIQVPDINDKSTEIFTKGLQPDIVVVSGTSLVRQPLVSLSLPIGIINLHTGLSPYVKGGPNCTNWCIANNEFHRVGNTIMWLNAGIDSGNIITTETINIQQATDLDMAHQMVMNHAHQLYMKVLKYLADTNPPYNSVPQKSIEKGNLYLTKMWTSAAKRNLLKNWNNRDSFVFGKSPVTVHIPNSKQS